MANRQGHRPLDAEAEAVTGTEPNHETDFHGSHRDYPNRVGPETVEIAGEEKTVSAVVELERIRRTRREEYLSLMESMGQPTRRRLLAALIAASPRTYSDLSGWSGTTTRTVKTHVSDLSGCGILSVRDGRPATVAFEDDSVRVLASDVLSYL